MTQSKKTVGIALAAAAAALFVSSVQIGNAAEGSNNVVRVKCFGGNACKGQSDCKTTTNACKGLNACKSEGFTLNGTCERPGRA